MKKIYRKVSEFEKVHDRRKKMIYAGKNKVIRCSPSDGYDQLRARMNETY